MKSNISITVVFSFLLVIVFSCNKNNIKQSTQKETNNYVKFKKVVYKLEDTLISFNIYSQGNSKCTYFNMHDDENTSVDAVKMLFFKINGSLIEIDAMGERLLSFNIDNYTYRVDPNRIYTPVGLKKTLQKYSKYSPAADSAVEKLARFITDSLLSGTEVMVAMHNNTENNYSIKDYAKGGDYESDAADVYINPKYDTDDFFYVSRRSYFDAIKSKGYNVILQDNNKVTDDGSLSVYCGKKDIKYINVEAQRGHLQEQIDMLLALQEILNKPEV